MPWQDLALGLAGVIGASVAIAHGFLLQRLIVQPFAEVAVADRRFSATVQRLVPLLLHFSTLVWFVGGIALLFATQLNSSARLWVSLMVGGTFLFGAIGNFWATRGRHPGWMLMALSFALILFGVAAPVSRT